MSQVTLVKVNSYTPGTVVQTLTGNNGGAVGPNGSNNIYIIGVDVVSVDGNPGTNTLEISLSGAVADEYDCNTGTAIPALGVLNIVGTGNIATSGAGNTITADLAGITQHSLQVGGTSNTLTQLGVATNGQIPIGSTGADPVLATITAGVGIAVTNGAGSIEISADNAGFVWTIIATGQIATDNNGYFTNDAGVVTVTLPAISSVGDTFQVAAMSAGGWTIAQGAGQQIRLGNTTTTLGAGGSLASTAQGDWITCICSVANTNWIAYANQGNITIV